MTINLLVSSQKLSEAEIASQFRGVAAIWDPAKQAKLAMFWIPAFAGMTIWKKLSIIRFRLLTILCLLPLPSMAQSALDEIFDKLESGEAIEEVEQPAEQAEELPKNSLVAKVQGLNKASAKTENFEIAVGSDYEFGRLLIYLHRCWKSGEFEKTDYAALIEIFEQRPSGKSDRLFSGWMFASSPGISALEHPVYDITLLSCFDPSQEIKDETEQAIEEKPAEDEVLELEGAED